MKKVLAVIGLLALIGAALAGVLYYLKCRRDEAEKEEFSFDDFDFDDLDCDDCDCTCGCDLDEEAPAASDESAQ